jgi:hypothetical protein
MGRSGSALYGMMPGRSGSTLNGMMPGRSGSMLYGISPGRSGSVIGNGFMTMGGRSGSLFGMPGRAGSIFFGAAGSPQRSSQDQPSGVMQTSPRRRGSDAEGRRQAFADTSAPQLKRMSAE